MFTTNTTQESWQDKKVPIVPNLLVMIICVYCRPSVTCTPLSKRVVIVPDNGGAR